MKVTKFAEAVTRLEGGKVNLSIAQVSEVLRIVNEMVGGALYLMIRGTDRRQFS